MTVQTSQPARTGRDHSAEWARRNVRARELGFASHEQLRAAIARGEYAPAAERRPSGSAAVVTYLRELEALGYARATIRTYRIVLVRAETSTGRALFDAHRRDLTRWLATERAKVDGAALGSYRHVLAGFYRWAYDSGRLGDDRSPLVLVAGASTLTTAWRIALDERVTALRAAGRAETTIRTHRRVLSNLARTVHPTGPWDVTSDDLVAWLGTPGWAREYRRSNLNIVRGLYRWALGTERIDVDPTTVLASIRSAYPSPHPTPLAAYRAALDAADVRVRLMLRLAGECGLRRGEVAVVHAHDLSWTAAGPTLRVHGKGDRQRLIPLTESLAGELAARGPGYAFPGKVDGHLSPWWVGTLVGRSLPPGCTMHGLRHRFATTAYSIDRDVFTVQDLLGHASPATTLRYVQLPDDAKRRTMLAVAAQSSAASSR